METVRHIVIGEESFCALQEKSVEAITNKTNLDGIAERQGIALRRCEISSSFAYPDFCYIVLR